VTEYRRIKIVPDAQGLPHVYVLGTDIELAYVHSARVDLQSGSVPVARLEILEPEVEIKPRVTGEEARS